MDTQEQAPTTQAPNIPAGGRVLANGAITNASGKIVAMQKGNTEHSRAMAARRWDKARAAAAAAMAAKVQELDPSHVNVCHTPVSAWGALVGHAAGLVLQSDNPRGVADLGRFVGSATGMLAERGAEQAAGVQVTATIPAGDLLQLVAALRQERENRQGFDNSNYREHDVIDIQAQDTGTQASAQDTGHADTQQTDADTPTTRGDDV